jgi:hypothetical protein
MPADACAPLASSRCSVCALRSLPAAAADAARTGRGNGALTVQWLGLPAHLYTAAVGEAAAACFPALTALELSGDQGTTPAAVEAAAIRLAQGLAAASRHAAASAAAKGNGEVATGLQKLYVPGLKALPSSLGDALAAMSQLTELHVESQEVPSANNPAAAQLSRLTQLRSLELGSCFSDGLAAVVPALTSLPELSFGAAMDDAIRFEAPAPALTNVTLRSGKLDVTSFVQLPALQQLKVSELSAEGPAPPGGWRLPAQLQTLELSGCHHSVQLLSSLQPPTGMSLWAALSVQTLWLKIDLDLLTADESALLQEGEAALCRALRFLGQHLDDDVSVGIFAREEARVLPVGGPDGVGPGRRNHAWLAELAAIRGLTDVNLQGLKLSAQDLEALSRQNLESLSLLSCAVDPLSALTSLGRSPSLATLTLDVGSLTGCDDEEEVDSEAVLVKAVQLGAAVTALYTGVGWRGKLVLCYIPRHAPRILAELEAAQQELIAAGVAADIEMKVEDEEGESDEEEESDEDEEGDEA